MAKVVLRFGCGKHSKNIQWYLIKAPLPEVGINNVDIFIVTFFRDAIQLQKFLDFIIQFFVQSLLSHLLFSVHLGVGQIPQRKFVTTTSLVPLEKHKGKNEGVKLKLN